MNYSTMMRQDLAAGGIFSGLRGFTRLVRGVGIILFLGIMAQADGQAASMTNAVAGVATADGKVVRMVIVGDSTVCEYPEKKPERGWGMYIEENFKPGTVKVINLAASGRSTKTFIQEGRWAKALAEKPDYVLIQFGHNDSHSPDHKEATDAATDYKTYLRQYIDESRAIGATPILVTPMVRRTFGTDGKLEDPLQRYADAMKDVATEKKVPVIDLHASSKGLVVRLGPTAAAELANRKGDLTHFNEKGARTMAGLVMKELPVAAPKLKELLKGD